MVKNILLLLFVSFCLSAAGQSRKFKLVTTQISKGYSPGNDYIQLLVDGQNTCSEATGGDSIANLSHIVVYDSNLDSTWVRNGTDTLWGIASGKYRFPARAPWDSVSFGAQILIYNDKNKNSDILRADNRVGSLGEFYVIPISDLEFIDSVKNDTSNFPKDSILPSPQGASPTGLGLSSLEQTFAILLHPVQKLNDTTYFTGVNDWSVDVNSNELPGNNRTAINNWVADLLKPATRFFGFQLTADPPAVYQVLFDSTTLRSYIDTIKECPNLPVSLYPTSLSVPRSTVTYTWVINNKVDTIFGTNGAGLPDTTIFGGDTLNLHMFRTDTIRIIGTTSLKCVTKHYDSIVIFYTRPSIRPIPKVPTTYITSDSLSVPRYDTLGVKDSATRDSTITYMGFCAGSSTRFHAHPDTLGTSDAITWIHKGIVVSYDSLYTYNNIPSGTDTLIFHIKSNIPCLVRKDIYDTLIIRGLDSIPIPTVTISAGNLSPCANGIDTFTAVLSTDVIQPKMDTSARYQLEWYVGGSLAFRDTLLYHDTDGVKKIYVAPNFSGSIGDSSVYAVLLAQKTQSCPYYYGSLTNPPDSLVDTSNTIHLSVLPVYTPTITNLIATQTGLCMWPFIDSVQFTANTDSITNGAGTNPKFLWYLNGVPVQNGPVSLYAGTDSARLGSDSIINNGDTSLLISNGGLYYGTDTIGVQVINTTATCFTASDTSVMKILPLATFDPYPPPVNVAISSSQPVPFCKLLNVSSVSLSPQGTNLGTRPQYVWALNGKEVYDSANYVYNQVIANDSISLWVKSSVACTLPKDTATASLVILITNPFVANVSIDPTTPNTVCQNQQFKIYLNSDSSDKQSLDNPATTFDVYVNGNLQQPSGIPLPLNISSSNIPVGVNSVFVVMHSGVDCIANPNDTSNAYTLTVNPSPVVNPITGEILGDGTIPPTVCVGSLKGLSETTLGGVWSTSLSTALRVDTFGAINGIDSAKVTGLDASAGSGQVLYTVTDPVNSCSTQVSLTININLNGTPFDTVSYKTRCTSFPYNVDTIYNSGSQGHWISSDNNIATVQNFQVLDSTGAVIGNEGVVTAVGNGKVYITDSIYTPDCGTTLRIDTIVVGPPVIDSITGNKTICLVPNATSQLSAHVSGDTAHSWSSDRPDIATVDQNGLVSWVSAGTANIYYTAYNLCGQQTGSIQIQVGPPTTAGTIGGTNILCVGTTNSVNVTGASGGVWSIKGQDTLYASIDSLSGVDSGKLVGSATIYYTVSNTCGSISSSYPVTVATAPAKFPITSTDTIVCYKPGNNNLQLNNAASGGVWESENTNLATIDPNSGLVTGISGGIATMRYTVTQSCGSYHIDTTIIVGEPVKGNYTYNNPICAKDTLTITNNIRGANTYSWSVIRQDGNNLKTIDGNHAQGVFVGVNGGNATILFVAVNRCGSTLKDLSDSTNYINIKVNSLPLVPAIAGKFTLCLKDTTTLTDAAAIKGDWSIDKFTVANIDNQGFLSTVSAGNATVGYKVIDKATGCHDSVSQSITINPLPVVPAIGGENAVCHGRTITLKDSAAVGATGTWSSVDPSIAAVTSDGTVRGLAPSRNTTIKYVVVDGNSCKDSATTVITVNAIPSIASITTSTGSIDSVCVNNSAQLIDGTNTNGVWSVSNSTASITSAGVITGVTVGYDTVGYKITTNGCDTAVSLPLKVTTPYVAPIVMLDKDSVPVGLTIHFKDDTKGGSWSFYPSGSLNLVDGDGTVTGKYPGSDSLLYTIHSNGCTTSAGFHIMVLKPLNDIYIPNYFSPYSTSQVNQTFMVLGKYMTGIDFNVYSPWGALMYHTSDVNAIGWDGKFNGQEMPSGVYVYTARITVKDINGKESVITKKGSVNLVR